MRWRWALAAALILYCLLSALLIAQRPGLQYDEALLTAGGVALRHQELVPRIANPHTWTCQLGVCFPLMAEGRYIGAIKEYMAAGLFALFGPSTEAVRVVAALLGLVGLWGIALFVYEQVGPRAGVATAFVLAIHPSYLNMTVFDNGAVSATMAALGLSCAAISLYLRKRTAWAALLIGVATGFGVWSRANFVWTVMAVVLAIAIVYWKHAIPPLRHAMSMIAGGIIGAAPFLAYQIKSRGGTFEAVDLFQVAETWGARLQTRSAMLLHVLLTESEHTVMWGAGNMPNWQLWLFGLAAAAACVACLLSRSRLARATALAFVFLSATMFATSLQIAEHHLISALPFAVGAAVMAAANFPQARVASGAFAVVYVAAALHWYAAEIRGFRDTGGIGVWSNAIDDLTSDLQASAAGRPVRILDWGLMFNLFVLSDGALDVDEIENPATLDVDERGQPWADVIREGGMFVVTGPNNRNFSEPLVSFLDTLAKTRPIVRATRAFAQGNGDTYATWIDIAPDTLGQGPPLRLFQRTELRMDAPDAGARLTGFHAVEGDGARWTGPKFTAVLDTPGASSWLEVNLYVADAAIEKLGPVTLSARIGSHRIAPETYREPGVYTYKRPLDPVWFIDDRMKVEFELDRWLPPSASDTRELGIVVRSITLTPR